MSGRYDAERQYCVGKREVVLKNFSLVEQGIDVDPILREIARWPEAWDIQTGRQEVTVQREARAIPIRGLRKSKIAGRARRNVHETRFTTISRQFPQTTRFLCEWAEKLDSELSRARLVNLPAGHRVYAHIDRGDYYAVRNRFHLIIKSEESWMRCGDEEITMRVGELWWFDNKEVHEANNSGASDRIHLIFDLEPMSGVLGVSHSRCSQPRRRR